MIRTPRRYSASDAIVRNFSFFQPPGPAPGPTHPPPQALPPKSHSPVKPRTLSRPDAVKQMGLENFKRAKEAEAMMHTMIAGIEISGKSERTEDEAVCSDAGLKAHEFTFSSVELSPAARTKWVGWSRSLINKLLARDRFGVYVVERHTGKQFFEEMPFFVRLGLHLVFVDISREVLDTKVVRKLFKELNKRQGWIYDNPDPKFVIPHIESFVNLYHISLVDLAQPDVRSYKTFNDFFARRLRPGARPVAYPIDPRVIVSPADCRVTVFPNLKEAEKLWIKGKEFTLEALLDTPNLAKDFGPNPSIAIFRLAPQDYHRFHSPFDTTVGVRHSVKGTYYTVNPIAVNENIDVFTANRRDVQLLQATINPNQWTLFAFVAVGSLLVGSIKWEHEQGDRIRKGDPLGYFQYGGSTCILIAPQGVMAWNSDLVKNSKKRLETYVRAGEQIGIAVKPLERGRWHASQ